MRSVLLLIAAMLLVAIGFFAWRFPAEPPLVPDQPVQGLVPGKGRGLVLTHCAVCHSTALVVSYRASRSGWDQVITRMQEEEGLWGLPAEDREAMLDYLAATQGLQASRERPPGPWAQPLYPPNPIW